MRFIVSQFYEHLDTTASVHAITEPLTELGLKLRCVEAGDDGRR